MPPKQLCLIEAWTLDRRLSSVASGRWQGILWVLWVADWGLHESSGAFCGDSICLGSGEFGDFVVFLEPFLSCSCNVPGCFVHLGEATAVWEGCCHGGLCFVFNNVRWVVRVKGTSTWMPVAKVSQEIISLCSEDQWYLLDLLVVLML